ncbi:hypothetical protein OXX69_006996 [Metschnikowia pulcherrima]
MSAQNGETTAVKRTNTRQQGTKPADSQRTRRKTTSANKGQNSANSASSQRSKTANASSSTNGSNGKSKQRQPAQRQADRTGRKSNTTKPQKSHSSIRNRDSGVNSGGADADIQDQEIMDIGDESIAAESSQRKSLPRKTQGPLQSYTPDEIAAAGPLFPDPAAYGFMAPQQNRKPRPVPRYMLTQPRLLAAPPFHQTPWDKGNQEKMLEMESRNGGADFSGIYEEFQKMRELERTKMEEMGLVDAENTAKDLNDAIFFQGTCLDMCPVFERVRRSLENNVKLLEKDPQTQKISRERAVKAFSRPAAGQPPPIPSDVRPPHVLMKTLDYIVDSILPQLPEAHSFIWDRTRSVRQDFIYQNYYGPEAIDCNERIVRIHLLSLHVMAGSGVEFSQQQELEQFNKALQTLTEIYQDVRNHGGQSPNEAEFRSYHLLSHFRDPELEREVQTLPDSVFKSAEVQLALRFRMIMSQSNVVERGYKNKIGALNFFVEFFRMVYSEKTPILLACLLETHFNEIRFYALKSLSRSYHTKGKAFSAESLRQMLGFDTLSRLIEFVSYYEIDTFEENGELLVDLCNKEKLESKYKLTSLHDKPKRAPACSPQLDFRLRNSTMQSLVNSGKSNADLHMNQAKISEVLQKITNRQNSPKGPPGPLRSEKTGIPAANAFGSTQSHGLLGQQKAAQPAFGGLSSSTPNQSTPVGSLSLSDFMNSQKVATNTASAFGKQVSSASQPAFDFTASKEVATGQFASPKPEPQKPTFSGLSESRAQIGTASGGYAPQISSSLTNLTSDKPSEASKGLDNVQNLASVEKVKPNLDLDKQKEKQNWGLKNETLGSKNVSSQNPSSLFDQPSTISNPKPSKTVPAASVQPKLLKDHQGFAMALESIYNDLLDKAIETEIGKVAAHATKNYNRVSERASLIDAFAAELYTAFVAEQTHQTMLKSVAKHRYDTALKKKAISAIQRSARKLCKMQEERRQRRDEIESTSFKAPSLKRILSASKNDSPAKRRASVNMSQVNSTHEDTSERQEQMKKLWQPIELATFVQSCAAGVKMIADDGAVTLNSVIVAENWDCPYSKWLSAKLSLKASSDKTHLVNEVTSDGLSVSFRSLPKLNFINEQTFRSTPFLVLECGLLEAKQVETHKTFEHKLIRDGGILSKLTQISDRYSYYKVQVLVLVWDITGSDMPIQRQCELLHTEELVNADNCVQDIRICDMSSDAARVNEDLQKALLSMGENFTGKLSKRGIHKRAEIRAKSRNVTPILEEPEPISKQVESSTSTLKAKEDEILRKARELQRRKYLTGHATANKSGDLTNVSGVFRTPNGSFANHTLMNYNTFLGNNTLLHARDASFMKSFANASMIEESTPMASPGPRSRTGSFVRSDGVGFPKKAALPKKVQELRDITASIKAKYKA